MIIIKRAIYTPNVSNKYLNTRHGKVQIFFWGNTNNLKILMFKSTNRLNEINDNFCNTSRREGFMLFNIPFNNFSAISLR
jgi:hypothetical protein